MKKYRLSPGEALERIREYRPQVEPNSGFMEQLELWQKMDYAEDVEDHPVYQRWIYKREVEESIAQGMAPTRIHFRDQEKEISKIASGSTDSRTGNANIELRCKKCRYVHSTPAVEPIIISVLFFPAFLPLRADMQLFETTKAVRLLPPRT